MKCEIFEYKKDVHKMKCEIFEYKSDIVIERANTQNLMNELNEYLGTKEYSLEVLLGEVSLRIYESNRHYIEIYSSANTLTNEYEIIPIVLKYSDNNSYIVFKKKETEDLFGWKNINGEIVELYK